MKRILLIILTLSVLLGSIALLPSCNKDDSNATMLSFKSASSYDYLKGLDGTQVAINGYMATSSPADGSYMFLMNLPYQSCPFCVPNTSQLSNTMAVYPQKNKAFDYTTQAIKVVGTLEVAKDENKPFEDDYGYQFNFRIVDADYTIVKAEDLGEDMALWQRIAQSDVVSDIYGMYDFLNFATNWPEYFVNSYTNAEGEHVTGYFLYASDALYLLQTDGAQWNFGYKEDYFDGLIAKIEAIDPDAFNDLEEKIREVEALAREAISELENGNYTKEYKYVEKFDKQDYVYKLNRGEEFKIRGQELFNDFADWLSGWEL